MQFWVLFLLGLCVLSCTTSKNVDWKDSFKRPYKNTFSGLRIVNGQTAAPYQFPYQVGMYAERKQDLVFCGGSLISRNYVLTAAHCAEGALSIELIFGALNITDENEYSQQRQISDRYVVHPDWDVNTISNDLAIIELAEPVRLNRYVQTVKLASGGATYAGNQGVVAGWGINSDTDIGISNVLKYVTNKILSNAECKETGSDYNAVIQDVHLCLSGSDNKGTCQGDSGGPLISNGVQVGVTSFNYKSCEASMPSVFVRISEFIDWIRVNSDID